MSNEKKDGKRAKRSFSEEFKREAVRLVTERPDGISFTKIARDLDPTATVAGLGCGGVALNASGTTVDER